MDADALDHKLKAWVVFPGNTKFGAGRARLLRLVEQEGSLNKAVRTMGMSYRAAWGYVKELEEAAGFAFVEPAGAGPSAGMQLTARGRRFLECFEDYLRRLDAASTEAFAASFGERNGA